MRVDSRTTKSILHIEQLQMPHTKMKILDHILFVNELPVLAALVSDKAAQQKRQTEELLENNRVTARNTTLMRL
jgi:hypothetical protein